jgi:hypothetical protein
VSVFFRHRINIISQKRPRRVLALLLRSSAKNAKSAKALRRAPVYKTVDD